MTARKRAPEDDTSIPDPKRSKMGIDRPNLDSTKHPNGQNKPSVQPSNEELPQHRPFVSREEINVASHDNPNDARLVQKKALSSDVATILVGPDEHQFKVHEALLSYSSDFFRAALRGNFTEGRDMIVSLPDATSAIFDLFVQWLYNHNGCWERKSYSGLTTLSNFRVGDEIRALNLTEYADLFHLADYLACPTLQRDIQQMFEMGNTGCQECPNANEITYVYENFEKRGSGAFFINFVVQFFTESAPLSAYGQPDEYPIAFWTDIALAQRKHRRRAEQKLAAYKESYDSLKLTCS